MTAANNSARAADAHLTAQVAAAASECLRVVAALSDDELRAPSGLPDWTRGHVIAHVWGISEAMTRQFEHARRGAAVELYDGGYEGRTRRIEEGAARPAAEQRERLGTALTTAVDTLAGLGPEDWERGISFRSGVVRDGAFALWRELVIHTSDLKAGNTPAQWTPEFCRHLLGFLEPRVPEAETFVLEPDGGPVLHLGSGARTVHLAGTLTSLATWMAGRAPLGTVTARSEDGPASLPGLAPWPAGVPVPQD